VVSTLPENTAVSVSEEADKGWRKIRLPDGGVGYVEDAAVALSDPATPPPADSAPSVAAPAPETAPAPAAPPPTTAPTHARIYVKDLDHFAELVKSDLEVHQRAESIASRTRTGKIVLFGRLGVGFVGLAGGASPSLPPTITARPQGAGAMIARPQRPSSPGPRLAWSARSSGGRSCHRETSSSTP
jgi:hypothetical protein